MKKFLLGLVFTIFVISNSSAQVIKPSQEALKILDQKIESFMKERVIPGAQIAVASHGKVIYLKSYGMANVELSVPVSDKSIFEIGSISKQFVSVGAMLLVEEGKLGLDDPIHTYLPFLPSEWLGVTVRHLMNHTSGIPDYEEIGTYDTYSFRFTPEEIIRIAHSRPIDFEPGEGWYYSNTGYFLLSLLVERIEGQPLDKILKTRIFDLLGMTNTGFANPEEIIPNRVSGYWVNKVGKLINRNPIEFSSTLGAGGILSTAQDLAKWDAALYGNGFLSEASKAAMWAPTNLSDGTRKDYGFGWVINEYKGLKTQNHSGQVAGFVANFYRFPEQDIAFIIFMNRYRVGGGRVEALIDTFMPNLP